MKALRFLCSGNSLDLKVLNLNALNNNLVTCSCTEKCNTDGRGVGDLAVYGVGLVGAYYVIGKFLVSFNVEKLNDRANADNGLVDLRLVDYLSVCDHLTKLCDTGVDLALLSLCFIILAVLRKVTECTCGGNVLLVFLYLYVNEVVELILKSLKALGGIIPVSTYGRIAERK